MRHAGRHDNLKTMYQSSVAFEAPLSPRMFFAADAHARENQFVFETTWQLIGLASSICKPGQYISTEVGSVPIVVRNFDGQLVALRNVCSHRHCTLVSARQGRSEKLKCPFHGWEFGADGRTRKIPAAKNFPDFDRERYTITSFPVERCGDLLFVRTSNDGASLREWLGELFTRIETWTSGPDWKPTVSRLLPMPANWKIPVEVSLESYHIPEVHPQSFGEDPGETKSEHAFAENSSSFFTSFNTPRLINKLLKVCESFIMKVLGTPFSAKYEHHHIYPNLLISHTPSLTLVQIVRPLTATTCVSDVWQYGRQSKRRNPISKMTAWLWGRFTGWLSYQILKEDMRIFSHVQRGEQAATDRSILGRCEERLYAFQKFLHDRIENQNRPCCSINDSDKSASYSEGTAACFQASCDAEAAK